MARTTVGAALPDQIEDFTQVALQPQIDCVYSAQMPGDAFPVPQAVFNGSGMELDDGQ